VGGPPDIRWKLAGDEPQGALFDEVERHVGRGEFRGMEFLHVRARRVVNEVPRASRMPFRYTINAYRGCSHACTYCLAGETPVLMADGRTMPIAALGKGDMVYGTVRERGHRRYVPTPVTAHWMTVKPAWRVELEDGTRLTASGDHRFLTDRGWKHVAGARHGSARRPELTTGSKLVGTGGYAPTPEAGAEYRLGYLCSRAVTEWPATRTREWCRGFVAGIFDAEGSHSRGVIRIAHTDPGIIREITRCLGRLSFPFTVETVRETAGCSYVRLTGGLGERLRFFHTVDPAVTRKRTIDGLTVESDAPLGVVDVRPLGLEMPMFDITTGTGDFLANGVVSHNCFARPTHEYLGMDAGEDFERRIVVKVNAVERVRAELAPGRWAGDHIAMGTNTDPYQRCEGKYRLTRGIVAELAAAANPFSILTKSTLILSDLDLLADAARRAPVRANLSIGTLDEEVWRATEPGTPHPLKRVEAVARLNQAGVPCGVLVAPVLPELSDRPDQLEAVVKACVEAGARSITPLLLHLRPGVREQYMGWLADARPNLVAAYERRYPGAYASKATQRELSALVARLVARHGGRSADPVETRAVPPRETARRRAAGQATGPPARQLGLGI
jgi:DNA repair photolyase